MLMKIAINCTAALMFVLWTYLAVTDVQRLTSFKRKHNIKRRTWGLFDLQMIAEESIDEVLKKDYEDLKKYSRRKFRIWLVACLLAIVFLLAMGVVSSKFKN
jgi:hypothetical protein